MEHNPCVVGEASLFVNEHICRGMLFGIWTLLPSDEHALLFVRDLPKTLWYLFACNWSVLIRFLFVNHVTTSKWAVHLRGRLWVLSPNTERIFQMLTEQSLCHILLLKHHVLRSCRVLLRELHLICWRLWLLAWNWKVIMQPLVHLTIDTCFFNPITRFNITITYVL